MAIKGKKKSQSRGSQARRRPAAAPRAVAAGRRGPVWYRTPQGRAIIIVALLIVAGVITGIVLNAKSNSQKLADRQDAVERYTGSVRALLQAAAPTAGEMQSAPLKADDPAALDTLKEQAPKWIESLNDAVDRAQSLRPTPGTALANSLFQQSITFYASAAHFYELVPDEPEATRQELLHHAQIVRDQANNVWTNAGSLLDEIRHDLELSSSGLTSPATAAAAIPSPAPSLTVPAPPAGGGGGNGKSDKKGSENGSK